MKAISHDNYNQTVTISKQDYDLVTSCLERLMNYRGSLSNRGLSLDITSLMVDDPDQRVVCTVDGDVDYKCVLTEQRPKNCSIAMNLIREAKEKGSEKEPTCEDCQHWKTVAQARVELKLT